MVYQFWILLDRHYSRWLIFYALKSLKFLSLSCACVRARVKIRGQLSGVSSLLPSYGTDSWLSVLAASAFSCWAMLPALKLYLCVYPPQCTCGCQRTTCSNLVSPSTTLVLGVELKFFEILMSFQPSLAFTFLLHENWVSPLFVVPFSSLYSMHILWEG